MSLKDMISSPLEAGTSILDAHHLPPHVLPALEWTSSRLARKSLHLTLVVARREYQIPSAVPPLGSPGMSMPSTPATPGRRLDFSSGPVAAIKQLVRSGSSNSLKPKPSLDFARAGIASPTPSQRSFELRSPKSWPLTPATPATPMSVPPMTPATASTTTTSMSSYMSSDSFGMQLIHAGDLPEKTERVLQSTLEKAESKFHVGPEWLSPASSASSCGLTTQLVHGSIIQNEVLFSSEGLTLLSLDRLYSLKSALSSYSKTKSHLRLEDAVDDLRRIILANNGAKVTKADIMRSYDWLSVSASALDDLDHMYRRAYGGPEMLGAISGMPRFVEPTIKSEWEMDDVHTEFDEDEEIDIDMIGIALSTTIQPVQNIVLTKPSPKPILKLHTDFSSTPKPSKLKTPLTAVENEDLTARPSDKFIFTFHSFNPDNHKPGDLKPNPSTNTIDQIMMTPTDLLTPSCETPMLLSPGRGSRLGPMTPNGYDDLSPTTRGEWGFLMVDDAFQGARTVAVETC